MGGYHVVFPQKTVMSHHSSLTIGSLLLRPKCLGIVQHEGVLVGCNVVLHNTPEKGEHISSVEGFAAGHPIQVLATGVHPSVIVARARRILLRPKAYDLLARNCQHTSSEIVRGVAKSSWAIGAAIVLAAIVVIWVVSVLSRRA